jgi:perosamine synthetase
MESLFERNSMIPLFYPPTINVELALTELYTTLHSRWWGQGPKVDRFEKLFGEKFGFKYCVMVNSGTAALHLAYILAGIKPGDKVLCPVLTCTATSHALLYQKADIIYGDIDLNTLSLDPREINRIGIKAIVLVHFGGYVDPRVIRQYPIPIIEDAAQALGAPGVGFGDFTCFSFQAIKHLTTGDGGMLVCKTQSSYQKAKRLRWFDIDREAKADKNFQAWDKRGITFDQSNIGYKYQATDIDASIGIASLSNFDSNQAQRQLLVNLYNYNLKDVSSLRLLPTEHSANWLYMIIIEKGNRDDFAQYMLDHGIETNVGHIRNDLFEVFGGKRLNLPNMNAIEFKYICLPLNTQITEQNVNYICNTIKEWNRQVNP